ncbi:MAG: HIT family protein [Chloroflexota bacterium]
MMNISHAPPNYQCPFCLLVAGIVNEHTLSRQSDIVYQTDRVTAFVASHQWRKNHPNILVIPNEHYENVYTLPADYGNDLQKAINKVALALKAAYNCDGVSTRQHNEPAGYQDVWHYHVHVTPRFKNDQLYAKMRWIKKFMPPGERASYAIELKKLITLD